MLHGSGSGVSAWANWNKVFPLLSPKYRVLAPDMVGFGYTDRPEGIVYGMDIWVKQIIDFMDALHVKKADLVGIHLSERSRLSIIPDKNKSMLKRAVSGGYPKSHE